MNYYNLNQNLNLKIMSNQERTDYHKNKEKNNFVNIYKIKCKGCNIQISSSKLELLNEYKNENEIIKIDKNYLIFVLTGEKEKLSNDKTYVYRNIKCMSCKKKLGKLIIFGNYNKISYIQKCIIKVSDIIIEREKEEINDNYLKIKEQTLNFYNSKRINQKLIEYSKKIFKTTETICENCILELSSFVTLQDYFINNGKRIENYFLGLIEMTKYNNCINEFEKFINIINKKIIENSKNDENDKNLKKKRNKSPNNNVKKKTKLY